MTGTCLQCEDNYFDFERKINVRTNITLQVDDNIYTSVMLFLEKV